MAETVFGKDQVVPFPLGRGPATRKSQSKEAVLICSRCRANMAHVKQSWPDYGLDFQVIVLKIFYVVPSLLGSGHMSREAGLQNHAIIVKFNFARQGPGDKTIPVTKGKHFQNVAYNVWQRENNLQGFKDYNLKTKTRFESKGQNLDLAVLNMPSLPDSGCPDLLWSGPSCLWATGVATSSSGVIVTVDSCIVIIDTES